ncbi:MAG: HD domain-containing protein, partial [Myxococcales bacterium]|nr:HD domain-containing protein [Myxococcales bacterium]
MILRDPVHGLVDFEGDAERVVGALLGTREVQRLRRIRQLGLTSLVFPGAEHSRFAHAVGAAHVMTRLFARIRAIHDALPPEHRLDADGMRDALAAALLHDLGHGPFSHLFEEVQPGHKHHEDWTVEALRDPGTEVHRALEGLSAGMAERVAGMLHGEHRLRYLARAVSGTLDVDRADYLLRDSHMTGV